MAQWLDEFDQMIWSDGLNVLHSITPIREFENSHSARKYSHYALKRHVEVRLEEMTRKLLHLQRIQRHAHTDEDAARVLGEFAAHAKRIWFKFVLTMYHMLYKTLYILVYIKSPKCYIAYAI